MPPLSCFTAVLADRPSRHTPDNVGQSRLAKHEKCVVQWAMLVYYRYNLHVEVR
jgi:hypothetical protein